VPSRDHDLTLDLFERVAARLEGDERDRLQADRRLIVELLELGLELTTEQVVAWVHDVDLH
jgi:hypothetical protein